jgi:DNA (cytosine-5)-methyltransferase 1
MEFYKNRERIYRCRKRPKFISEIQATVTEEEKVSAFEALYDLDFIGNNERLVHQYQSKLIFPKQI